MTTRRLAAILSVLAAAAAYTLVTPGTSGAAYCGIRWGSLAKSRNGTASPLVNVRAGRHDCFDRLVLDLATTTSGSTVRYVAGVPYQARDGYIPLRGGAFLEIVLRGPATYVPRNRAELVDVGGWRTFRQVAWGDTFEGYTTIGLGVRGRLPFRVFTLAGPGTRSRLVIDVAHRW